MNDAIKLSKAVKYSGKRIKADRVSLQNFITTDNILQNKGGVTIATGLPPSNSAMPAYEHQNILVGNIRPYLKKIWFANQNGGCSADVLVFEVKDGYEPKFIYYSMFRDDFFNHMMKGSKGTKMPRGDKNQILDFLIPDFDLPTQKKIAAVLSSLDSKIELNNRINAELEAMAKTLYDYWFVQFDFPDAKGKPYKSSGGKMVWNEELKRDVPEGWEVDILGNHITIERGISYKGSDIRDKGIPMVNLNSFYLDGRYKDEGIKYFAGSINKNKIIHSGDLIIATTDVTRNAYIIGKSFILPDLYDGDIVASCDLAKVNIEHKLDKYFLDMLFNSENYHRYIKGFASGTLVLHLDTKGIDWYKCLIPQKDLLNKYAAFKVNIDSKKTITLKENQQLSQLRDWLLPMLMNGQVTVKDMEEENLSMAAEPEVVYGKKKVK